jgi:hypothetical protein
LFLFIKLSIVGPIYILSPFSALDIFEFIVIDIDENVDTFSGIPVKVSSADNKMLVLFKYDIFLDIIIYINL